jgi:serine/threonine protein kinase
MFKTLDHPNIIKILDVIEDEHKIYLILEAVKGLSLYMHIMDVGEMSETESAIVASQIISIVRYLHKK